MVAVAPPADKEDTRNKRKKKSRHNNDTEADGKVSRRGRKVEVFEPSRLGQKRKLKKGEKSPRKTEITISKAIKRVIRITDSITVGELAKRMGIKANEIISELMRQGTMVSINHPLDF
jgi:translation initiation factor IF-2